MGALAADAAFKQVLPCSDRFQGASPPVPHMLEGCVAYGSLNAAITFGFERNFLGSMRAQYKGGCKFIMAPASTMQHMYSKIPEQSEDYGSAFEFFQFGLKDLTDDKAKDCKASGKAIYHGVIQAGNVLFVPAGYATVFQGLGASFADTVAVKSPFLPSPSHARAARAELDQILKMLPGDHAKEALEKVLADLGPN